MFVINKTIINTSLASNKSSVHNIVFSSEKLVLSESEEIQAMFKSQNSSKKICKLILMYDRKTGDGQFLLEEVIIWISFLFFICF